MTGRAAPTAATILLAGLLIPSAASPLPAQRWWADVAAGSATHEALAGAPDAVGATIGVRREGLRWLYLSAGIPFDEAGLPWLAGGIGGRFLLPTARALQFGTDASVHPYAFHDRSTRDGGGGVTVEALPLLAVSGRGGRIEIRSGLMHHAGSYPDSSFARTVHHSDARGVASLGTLAIAVEARGVRAPEAFYPYLGGGVEAPLGAGSVWGSAGRWMGSALDAMQWAVGARLPAGRVGEFHASYRRDGEEPLLSIGPRTVWTLGVTRRLGAPLATPGTRPAPVVRGTLVEFRLPAADAAEAPSVGGDFTGWEAVPMRRQGAHWLAVLPVPPGVHRYAFRTHEGEWFVPEGVPGRVDDGFGGYAATLVVP